MSLDWDKLRVFHAAADAGSFTHAAETLRLSQSAISRQVSALEHDVGVPLFHRHARGLVLTEQGELLYQTAHDVLMKLDPKSGQWTVYRMPATGCETRSIFVDRRRDEVWLPCDRTARVVRVQFRTPAQLQALKDSAK